MTEGPNAPGSHWAGVVDTPPKLAQRLVEPLIRLVGPQARLLDPACGIGQLLAAARAVHSEPKGNLFGIETDPERGAGARERLGPGADVRIADALEVEWPAATHVIANPPWVSFSGRQARAVDRRTAANGWPSLHGAFVERIAEHVSAHRTRAAILLPASVAELDGYAQLRARVDRGVRIDDIEELGEDAFPGIVEPAILVRFSTLR